MVSSMRKPWIEVAGAPVVVHTIRRFASLDIVREIILVVHPDDLSRAEALREEFDSLVTTVGGDDRPQSVRNGLELVSTGAQLVAIQDGVRPFVDEELIRTVCLVACKTGAAIPAVPVRATLKEAADDAVISRTVSREGFYEAQTPQVFRTELIRRAYDELTDSNVTDDAQVVERIGEKVVITPGSTHNIKLTTPDDLKLAEVLLAE